MKKWKQWGKSLLRIFCAAAAAVLLGAVLLALSVERLLFRPPEKSRTPGDAENRLMLPAGAETIAVFYLPGPPGANTVLYSHGNAEDLGMIRYRMNQYVEHGYGVAAYDYEGYGMSDGTPSESAAYRDIERVWRWLVEEKKIPQESIVIHGFSVGTGPSCYLAEKVNARALILEAPFQSTFAVAGVGFLPFNRFPNIDRIANIDMPLLIIHGDADRIIPFSHGRKLFETAKEPKTLYTVEGAGHNNLILKAGENYWKTLRKFLDTNPAKQP